MWTEDVLPDTDLESVYGREALQARMHATVARVMQRDEERQRRLEEAIRFLTQLARGERPPQNSS